MCIAGYDCNYECGGNAYIDDCGVCDGPNADMDECGECFGDGSTCDETEGCVEGTEVCYSLVDNGDGTTNLNYETTVGIGGFQFNYGWCEDGGEDYNNCQSAGFQWISCVGPNSVAGPDPTALGWGVTATLLGPTQLIH
jgi:hypothetical protein